MGEQMDGSGDRGSPVERTLQGVGDGALAVREADEGDAHDGDAGWADGMDSLEESWPGQGGRAVFRGAETSSRM